MNFYNKYIKYKYKYTQIKNQYGGVNDVVNPDDIFINDVNPDDIFIEKYYININENLHIVKDYLISKINDTKIGYTDINNIYIHYSIEEFIELLDNNEVKDNIHTEKHFIYIITNFDKIQSKLINITECNDLIIKVPLILQDIIFCKIGIALFCIDKILEQIINNDKYFSLNQYKELIIISINYQCKNLELITETIKNYLGDIIYFQIATIAVNNNGFALEYVIEELLSPDNYESIVTNAIKQNAMSLKFASIALKNLPRIVLNAVKLNGMSLKYASDISKESNIIVKTAIRQNGLALQHSKKYLNNIEFIKIAMIQNVLVLQYVSKKILQDNIDIVKIAVMQNGMILDFITDEFNDYIDIVKKALMQNGMALKFLSNNFKNNNIDIVKIAIEQNGIFLKFLIDDFKNDNLNIVKIAVQQNGMALEFLTNEFKNNNKDIVILAVQQNGMALEFLIDEFKNNNLNIIRIAVQQNGMALEFLTDEFKNDNLDIIRIAVKQNGMALEFLTDEFKNNNKDIIILAVQQNGMVLKNLTDVFKNDREIVTFAVQQNGMVLNFVIDNFKSDPYIINQAVSQNGMVFKFINDNNKNNKNIIKSAIAQNYMILEFIDSTLITTILNMCTQINNDSIIILNIFKYYPDKINLFRILKIKFDDNEDFNIKAVSQNGLILEFLNDQFKNNINIIKIAVEQNGMALKFVNDYFKNNIHIVKIAVKQNGMALEFVNDNFKENNIDIIKIAVKQNGMALEFVNDQFKNNIHIVKIAVKQNGMALEFVNDNFKENNIDIVKIAVEQNGMALKFVKEIFEEFFKIYPANNEHDIFETYLEINKKAIEQNGLALEFVNDIFKNNLEIIDASVSQNGMALEFVINDFKTNLDIIKKAVTQNEMALKFVDCVILYKLLKICNIYDRNLVLKIFEYYKDIKSIYTNLNEFYFKTDINFIIEVIKQNIQYYLYCSDKIKNSEQVIIEVLKINITYYVLIPKIQQNNEIIINHIIEQNKKNNYISNGSYINILHIGYLKLDNTYSNVYIKYNFIEVNINSDINTIILKIKQFKTRVINNKNKYNKYYILITLDTLSYLQYYITINSNINTIEKLPDLLYDNTQYVYKNIFPQFNSDTVIEVNIEYKNKIEQIYSEIENELTSTITYINIYIINIATTNILQNSNYYNKIINILINKYRTTDKNQYDNYTENNYRYKHIELSLDVIYDNKLLSHWLNNLFITPNILQGRQKQISGTCTTNAIFNSLFLVNDIKEVLILKYNTFKEKDINLQNDIDYTDLRFSHITDKSIILYSIIGNLIKNIKQKDDNINYMVILAAHMKNISYTNSNYEYIYNSIKSLLSVDDFNKFKEEPFFKICRGSVDNSYRQILCSNSRANSNTIKILNSICYSDKNKNICNDSTDYDDINGYIYGNGANFTVIMEFFKLLFSISDKDIKNCMNNFFAKNRGEIIIDDDNINILFICNNFNINKTEISNLKEIENRNGNDYLLQSCLLSNDTDTHVICGIKNYEIKPYKDFDYYIYDSNNIYSNDDWSKLLITSTKSIVFKELERKKKIYYRRPFQKRESYMARYFIYTYKKTY